MTENQWPQGTDPSQADPYPTTAATAPTASTTTGGSTTRSEAAKDEAANVASQVAGAAGSVAQTAKSEAAHVAADVKYNARDLMNQARTDLTSQAGTQQQKAAEGLRSISSQLRSMADAPDQRGVAADLVRQVAERSESVATWLGNRDPGSVLDDAKAFARQRPGTFLLLAAGAGLLAGRLGRSLQAGPPTSGTAGTWPSRHYKTDSTNTAVFPGTLDDDTTLNAYGEPGVTGTGPAAYPAPIGGTPAGDPLRDTDDPYAQGGGRPL
jgi:hypothetical protein